MKMTMHIDEALLDEVMKATGAASKTAAVAEALRRVASKFRQRERWKIGLGMTADEIRNGFDAGLALGTTPAEPAEVTKTRRPVTYGRKRPR